MGNAISTCFKKYATFSGRATRSEYWFFYLFFIFSLLVGTLLGMAVFGANGAGFFSVITLIYMLPLWAVSVRRAHDSSNSGWLLLVPIYGWVLHFLPTVPYENKYGRSS